MKSSSRQALGRVGEALAADFLEKQGYNILERNWRTPYGEIDLIASLNKVTVFIEVKTRSNSTFGPPEISITPRKAEHMYNAAEYYIQQHPEQTDDWRIDVITVQIRADNLPPLIDHFENITS